MSDVQNHGERAHSVLSASGSSMWMNCPPSARKNEHIPNIETSYAKEGTLAHELAETELKKYFGFINIFEYKNKIREIEESEYYSDDMPEFVQVYVDHCIEEYNYYKSICESVAISIEEKIDLTKYIPEGFGANDFVIIADNIIVVIDLKYGRGVQVSAIDNSQLKLYGLGSVYKHRLSYKMNEVKLTVVQPRIYNTSSFIISVEDLEHWADTEVTTKAKIAFEGGGEFNPGEWCKFCKFKPKCKAIHDKNLAMIKEDFRDPSELTEEEFLEVHKMSNQIRSWLDSIDAAILSKLLNKEPVTGYKLVKGQQRRTFIDPKAVVIELEKNGFNESDFMGEPKLLGITAIEKLVGKKDFAEGYTHLVRKSDPKPNIAPISDKREDYYSSAENDFL